MQTGATLNVGSGVNVLIQQSQTITDNGALNVNSTAAVMVVDGNSSQSTGIMVNGTLTATGASFARFNGSNGDDNTFIQVYSGGELTAADSTFWLG